MNSKKVGELLFGLGVKDEIKYLKWRELGRKIQVNCQSSRSKNSKRTNLVSWFGVIQKSRLNITALDRLLRL